MFDPNMIQAALAQKASTEAALGLRNDMEAYRAYQEAEIADDFAEELKALGIIAIEGDQEESQEG